LLSARKLKLKSAQDNYNTFEMTRS